ncbi:hypothetical protein AB4Z42_02510 [Mycobacterium sp. 2YAF39]|uniref:hypothetical protein n=1 Tax=Mycobacterium sp. 2YAF39 TaxID=3233033 RepID=UPI003F9D630E
MEPDGEFNYGLAIIGGSRGEVTAALRPAPPLKGGTEAPSFDETRVTNDATGRGMFVGVDPF